jgi:hypothetical protein
MKRHIIFLLLAFFAFSTLPLELFAGKTTLVSYSDVEKAKPRKKYKKRTNSAPKTVHVKGYRKKNGTYVHSYYRRSPRKHK